MTVCKVCGSEFHHASRVTQKYCGAACRVAFFKSAHGKPEKSMYVRQCRFCQKSFETSDGRKVYCSKTCHYSYQNAMRPTTQHVDRKCKVCKTMFKPQQVRGVGRSCCSDDCTQVWRTGKQVMTRRASARQRKSSSLASVWMKQDRIDNPDKYRDKDLKKRFGSGFGVAEYEKLLAEQNGVCAICKGPETAVDGKTGKVRRLAVDHCHEKGHVRKLLCTGCNQGIGNLKEKPELLEAAIKYLQEHKK